MQYDIPRCRFVAEEEQKQSLLQQSEVYQRRIQELQSGLQELGREHQTLQIVKSRQSERKWESDKDASNCSNCNVKFSVSVRKVSSSHSGVLFEGIHDRLHLQVLNFQSQR